MYCVPFSVIHKGVPVIITRVIITVKNRPWISLVKLVVSILTQPLFLAKRETTFEVTIFGRSLFRGSLLLAFANTCEIFNLLSEGCFFRGEGCHYYRNFTVNKITSQKLNSSIQELEINKILKKSEFQRENLRSRTLRIDEEAVTRRPLNSFKFMFYFSPRSDSSTFSLVYLKLDLNHGGLENYLCQTAITTRKEVQCCSIILSVEL